MKGALIPGADTRILTSPVTKNSCLYFYYLKEEIWQGDDGEERDTVDEKSRVIDFYIIIDDKRLSIPKDDLDLAKGTRRVYNETLGDGGSEFQIQEYIIPVNARAWVFGIPHDDFVNPAAEKVIICLSEPDEYIAYVEDQNEDATTGIFISLVFLGIGLVLSGIILYILIIKKTVHIKKLYYVNAEILYNYIMRPKQHSLLVGSKVEIRKKAGSPFAIKEGRIKQGINGTVLYLKPNEMIILAWRQGHWLSSYPDSIVSLYFTQHSDDSTTMELFQCNMPSWYRYSVRRFWKKWYFRPLKKCLKKEN
ncbi:MAG: SRPBCC domain-containing protein [Spirochaetales bacterium]|nr:SRPBCC domain-containing protein [Spirochaetales bacterium]